MSVRMAVLVLYIFAFSEATYQIWKSSQVYFTIRLKVRRQETAIGPCGHLGQLHLLAILNRYTHQLNLVMEPQKKKKFKTS